MKSEKILAGLKRLGLSDKESRVYHSLLGMGEASATKISKRTGITRTLIYEIMNKLIVKGLASSVVKEGKSYFSASDPDILLSSLEDKLSNLKEIMPDLKSSMLSSKEETKVELYRGRKGLNSVLKMILSEAEEYFIQGGGTEACSYFEHENRVFVKRAADAGIKGRLLVRKGEDFFIGKLERFRYLPPKMISLVTSMIWKDKTAIFLWSKPYYVIVTENSKIAQSNLSTFEYLWELAEKPTKADVMRKTFD